MKYIQKIKLIDDYKFIYYDDSPIYQQFDSNQLEWKLSSEIPTTFYYFKGGKFEQ